MIASGQGEGYKSSKSVQSDFLTIHPCCPAVFRGQGDEQVLIMANGNGSCELAVSSGGNGKGAGRQRGNCVGCDVCIKRICNDAAFARREAF